jgi:hypothetical protein
MRRAACGQCQRSVPMNDLYAMFGQTLCQPCADEELRRREGQKRPPGSVARQVDPTVCGPCGLDNGDTPLPQVAGIPCCEVCAASLRNRPFPAWIKTSLAALLLLAVFSFVRNWRFFKAYVEVVQSAHAAAAHDLERAEALHASAARRVPESRELAAMSAFFTGARLMSQGKEAEALPHLQQARGFMPKNPTLETMILHAQAGVAFGHKDYDAFLAKAKDIAARQPDDARSVATVASALACKYAATGDPSFRKEALDQLAKAAALAERGSRDFEEYAERIHHRLETREIITREEFERRYPQGWKAEEVRR